MASTASSVAIAMEIIAALGKAHRALLSFHSLTFLVDLYYGIALNAGAAIFQIFASQMLGYGMAGMCECPLLRPGRHTNQYCSENSTRLPDLVRSHNYCVLPESLTLY